jgi:signal transduction histidine kinase
VTFILQETVGIPFDAPAAPSKLVVDPLSPNPSPSKWPIDLRSLVSQRELLIHNNVSHLLSSLPPRGNASSLPTRAATLPIVHGGELVGLLLIFLNGALPLDERMLIFLDLLGRQVSTSASMVASYEGELAKLEEMGALDRAKTAFFTNISHELRTPLTLILGPVGQLIEGLPAEGSATGTVLATGAGAGAGAGAGSAIAVANANASLGSGARAQLGIVERNARRLLRLVNTIMDFATAEAGRTTSTFVPTLLASFTADLASAFRSAAALGGLAYSVDVNEVPSGLMVYVDRDKYEKVVYNLLSNAVKYTLKGKVQVRVYIGDGDGGGGMDKGAGAGARDSASRGVAVKGERFVLEISDTGVGIPPNELGSVFDKFHRASTGQTQSQSQGQGSTGGGGQGQGRSIEGTGIGLAYTLELVKAHKGEVTVQSMPGEGSTFKIHLPLGKDHLPPGSVMEIEVPDQGEVGEWGSGGMTPSASSTSVSEVGHTGGRYMDELAQMVPPSEAETTSESLMSSSAVLWQPLIFGDRERARIMVADDNAVSVLVLRS